jgi:RHS repeat-associated protein
MAIAGGTSVARPATPSPTPTATPTPSPSPLPGLGAGSSRLPGDCNGDGLVRVDELMRGVGIMLGDLPLASCEAFDVNGDGRVTIDELIVVVRIALGGAPPAKATPTRPSPPTPTSTVPVLPTATARQPGEPPPDPETVAPPLDGSVATDIAAATAFLYEGPDPIQTDVAPGIIEPERVSVLRGGVRDRAGAPLERVRVSVIDHPELGQTLTRVDGRYDLAVNGGGPVTLVYERQGFLTAQRQADVPWRGWVAMPDVVLVPLDPQATTIDLGAPMPIQVARGSVQADADGMRQATVLVPQGTGAEMMLANGSVVPMGQLTIRATEYTVGPDGPEAMPGLLPPASGYTYAVELSEDEAMAAGARSVRFDRPLPFYVENFLDFPAGTAVPLGYYDRQLGRWIAAENGRVIAITGITGGLADLDVTGDGAADTGAALDALGITDAEREELARLYTPGQSLWRAPIPHFTPWDCNWPFGPPEDAAPPEVPAPVPSTDTLEDPCTAAGSIIGCESQTLGKAVGLTGSRFRLHYQSDRVPGGVAALDVTLSGATVPASLARIAVRVEIAGQVIEDEFPPAPEQTARFEWDGLDAYGRPVQGVQPATVRIDYIYPGVYQTPAVVAQAFALAGTGVPITGDRARGEIHLSKIFESSMGRRDARAHGLGGWTLDVHHSYDPTGRRLLRGDGGQRGAEALGRRIEAVDLRGFTPDFNNMTIGPDGSIYFITRDRAPRAGAVVRRLAPDGTLTIVAGDPGPVQPRPYGDGGPALSASFVLARQLAFGPDGSLYIADQNVIRRVGPDGIITTVAGRRRNDLPNGDETCAGFPSGNVPATESEVCPQQLLVTPDGSLYFAQPVPGGIFGEAWRLHRIGPDGIVTTVAGSGRECSAFNQPCGDDGLAVAAPLGLVSAMALAPGGGFLISSGPAIRRIDPDGRIRRVVSRSGSAGFQGDGGPALDAELISVGGMVVERDGSLTFTDTVNDRVRSVDPKGIIYTVAGTGQPCLAGQICDSGDGGPALQARLRLPQALAVHPDGSVYVMNGTPRRLRRLAPPLPAIATTDLLLAAHDGSELYRFDRFGRHLATLHGLTGAELLAFEYDAGGRLARVIERTGATDRTTTIERNAAGEPTAIVGPFGDRTSLSVDANGFLASIANPAGDTYQFISTAGGLLTSSTDPRGETSTYLWDAEGRLRRATDAADGHQELVRSAMANELSVARITKLGLTTTYAVQQLGGGRTRRTVTDPDGVTTTGEIVAGAGTAVATHADGSESTHVSGPDPRFGMQAPVLQRLTTRVPGGAELVTEAARTVTLADRDDVLSLTRQTDVITVAGQTTRLVWNTPAGTLAVTSPEGRTRTVTLDTLGRVTGLMGPGLAPSALTWDERGRLAQATTGSGPEARQIGFTYDGARIATITDPAGRTIAFTHDDAGRRIATTRPDGAVVALAWDAASNLIALTPPGRPAYTFTYDARGQLASVTAPGAAPTVYETDADGRLARVTRPDGAVVTLAYDDGGQLVARTVSRNGTPIGVYAMTYDEAGRPETLTAPNGVALAYTFDGPLPLSETWSGPVTGIVTRTFDQTLRPGSEAVDDETPIGFTYDADGFLTGAGAMTITRDAETGLAAGSMLGAVADEWTYDPFGAASGYAATANGTPLYATEWRRDALGRIIERREAIGGDPERTDTYAYDLVGRLVEVRRDDVLVEAYTWDENGNRLSATSGGVTTAATYDDQDRLLAHGTAVHSWDASGRLIGVTTAAGTTTYHYDPLGTLEEVRLAGGPVVTYLIDGGGRRVGKAVNGVPVQGFLYAGPLRLVAELDGAGNVVSRFVYAGGTVPAYMVKGTDTYRFITDAAGSVRLVVDAATGAVTQRLDYDAFGRVTADTNPGFQPFAFAGGLYDRDAGLVRRGARDYDPATGRWTTRDPIGFAGGSTNLYTYAGNDPVNGADPLGLDGFDWASLAAGALVGVLEGVVGVVDLVTGNAVSQVGRNLWDGISGILSLFDLHYAGPLDLVLHALDLETVVDQHSWTFLAGEICGTVAGGAGVGGGAALGSRAASGTQRALTQAAGRAVGQGPRSTALTTTSVRDAELAIARAIDREAAAFENAAAAQATRAAEESGLFLIRTGRSGNVARPGSRGSATADAVQFNP